MIKNYDVCAVGAAIIDITFEVRTEDVLSLGIKPGSMEHLSPHGKHNLLLDLKDRSFQISAGGSIANSAVSIAQLNGKASLVCAFSEDENGLYLKNDCSKNGLEIISSQSFTSETPTCFVFITPDGERAMRTELSGAYIELCELGESRIADSSWLCFNAYLIKETRDPDLLLQKLLTKANSSETKIAFSLAEVSVIESERKRINALLPNCDMVFCNEAEALSLSGAKDLDGAFLFLQQKVRNFIITRGARGSLLSYEGVKYNIPAFACQPIDMNGAGDIFMGSFIFGLCRNVKPEDAGRKSSYLAMKLVCTKGARIEGNLFEIWSKA